MYHGYQQIFVMHHMVELLFPFIHEWNLSNNINVDFNERNHLISY